QSLGDVRFVPKADICHAAKQHDYFDQTFARLGRTGENKLPGYSGSPTAQSASLRAATSAGVQSMPAKRRRYRNAGCNSNTRAAAAFASSSRPSFATVAASTMYVWLKAGLYCTALRAAAAASS